MQTPQATPRPNPADLGRSYEPEDDYGNDYVADNSGDDYDSDLGRSYDEEPQESIPGDYVVDYQPLENIGTDYSDDYDDSEADEYDDYNDGNLRDGYDDYDQEPERRKPLNFNK